MSRLQRVTITWGDEQVMETSGEAMSLSNGAVSQGFVPLADDDYRYFERVTYPDGRIEWFELKD